MERRVGERIGDDPARPGMMPALARPLAPLGLVGKVLSSSATAPMVWKVRVAVGSR